MWKYGIPPIANPQSFYEYRLPQKGYAHEGIMACVLDIDGLHPLLTGPDLYAVLDTPEWDAGDEGYFILAARDDENYLRVCRKDEMHDFAQRNGITLCHAADLIRQMSVCH